MHPSCSKNTDALMVRPAVAIHNQIRGLNLFPVHGLPCQTETL